MTEKKDVRPLGELFAELRQEIRTLIKQEMDLIRVELTAKLLQTVKDAAALGIGGILLYTGFLTLVAAIVLGIAVFIPAWLSALLVAIVFLVIGAILVQKGAKELARMKITPEKSTETIKETARWAKSQMR